MERALASSATPAAPVPRVVDLTARLLPTDEADEELPEDMEGMAEDDPHGGATAGCDSAAPYLGGADGGVGAYANGLLSLGRADLGAASAPGGLGGGGGSAMYWSSLRALRERYEAMRKEDDAHEEGHQVAAGGRRSSAMDMDRWAAEGWARKEVKAGRGRGADEERAVGLR
jgi:hypothetical protein